MKVLLIQPVPPKAYWPVGAFRSHWVPTGLAYLGAALLREGHEVRVHVREEQLARVDMDWDVADARLRSLLAEFRPDAVGLTVLTPHVSEARRIAGWAREIVGPHVLVVAGGAHPSAVGEAMLSGCEDIDVLVMGEGERTFAELLRCGPGRDVRGIIYRGDGQFIATPPRPIETDLDSLGPPAYGLFDMDYYTAANRWMIRWLKLSATNIRTSRGCPARCRFCAGHVVAGVGVRYHSIEYVMEQIRQAVDRFGVRGIHFEDDTVAADSRRLLQLCDAIRRDGLHRRIVWDCCLRVDQAEAGLLAAMKSAGCIQVEYGFESGSDATLKRLGKGANLELNRRAVSLTRQAGLRIFADIMIGLPGETERDFRQTQRFLRWSRPEVISPARLAPLPGTALYDALPAEVKAGLDWDRYAYMGSQLGINFTAMPDARLEKLASRFTRYTFRGQMMRAMLRDTPAEEREERRRLRRKLVRFICHHPIRSLGVPW